MRKKTSRKEHAKGKKETVGKQKRKEYQAKKWEIKEYVPLDVLVASSKEKVYTRMGMGYPQLRNNVLINKINKITQDQITKNIKNGTTMDRRIPATAQRCATQ